MNVSAPAAAMPPAAPSPPAVPPRSLSRRLGRALALFALVALGLVGFRSFRSRYLLPRPPRPSAAAFEHQNHVVIRRDAWGVPHVLGDTDADAAFGLAFANAEDDFPTIQEVYAASRGQLGLLRASKEAVINDYYTALVGVRAEVDADYERLAPETRRVLEGYAEGLNYYAWLHPDEADGRLFPLTGRDVAAGFVHKLPFLVGVVGALQDVLEGKARDVGDRVAASQVPADTGEAVTAPGSNAHAVHARRATDGVTRLNVNSHQPWEGPVTWYEAHVTSREGWNVLGGFFPGSPVMLHGTNAHLGWAHTVNSPDMVDVYKLVTDAAHPGAYRFGDRWIPFEKRVAPLVLDTGVFELRVERTVLSSLHGPVVEVDGRFYALRYGGMGRFSWAVEQWLRMNKATTLDEWKAAMRMVAVPMFNTVYADPDDVYFVYNAALPRRAPGHDYRAVLPGDDPAVVWSSYLPYDELPAVHNPPSGFVFSCNSSPFQATSGPGNPERARYPQELGIDDPMTNRAFRTLELLEGGGPVSREALLELKWDRRYSRRALIWPQLFDPLLESYEPRDAHEARALELVRGWAGSTEPDDPAATVAVLAIRHVFYELDIDGDSMSTKVPAEAFQRAVAYLVEHHGKVDVPLGEVQRLRRGELELAIGGGPDVMNAVYTKKVGDKLVGIQGDSYVLFAEYPQRGLPKLSSIHQYGNQNRPGARHYADQARLFAERKLRPTPFSEEEIAASLERSYRPGE
jgi:acyl-homoserine-lactone acylase